MNTSSSSSSSAFVLYVDHEGHPAPLSLCYHATASRRLASSVDRHPPSTMTEVDSAYCPQCLSFHDATTASNLGYCPKPTCRLCPLCRSVASIVVITGNTTDNYNGNDGNDDNDTTAVVAVYQCGNHHQRCHWNSKSCGIQQPIVRSSTKDDTDTLMIEADELEKVTTELGIQWKQRTEQRNQAAEEQYKSLLSTLQGLAKDQIKGLRSTTTTTTSTTTSLPSRYFPTMKRSNNNFQDGPEGWSVKALEDSIQQRERLYMAANQQPIGEYEAPFVSLEVETTIHPSLYNAPVESILLQPNQISTTTTTTSLSSSLLSSSSSNTLETSLLLPLPIPLRPRKSRRCRAELAEGRPGILLKPKLNPLEGDSSLRTGHGQWWKKDSSATEVVPRVSVSIHASDGTRHAFLLKVSNPTLGLVRLKLAPSNYRGEKDCWDDDPKNNNNNTNTNNNTSSSLLEHVLVDPLTQQTVDAQLIIPIANNNNNNTDFNATISTTTTQQQTETCELEAAEDSFLELGKTTSDNIPEQVAKWDAADVLLESKLSHSHHDSSMSMKLVGQKKSVAWFEVVLMEPNQATTTTTTTTTTASSSSSSSSSSYRAIPLALQIQVGGGSWESSLVQTQQLEEDDPKDYISFDVVIVWQNLMD
ncbi:hypothetical protein IV203_015886 [Nitzschia inconspicua]|uniref:Dynactin subunit 4 n=1 Tax=Nitzschia inconspicua TaxID=303405 RepID=A0A9K3LC16_9STRA|nr:hypothetical protein IV203_015886 [Nitzschia inconspicua]